MGEQHIDSNHVTGSIAALLKSVLQAIRDLPIILRYSAIVLTLVAAIFLFGYTLDLWAYLFFGSIITISLGAFLFFDQNRQQATSRSQPNVLLSNSPANSTVSEKRTFNVEVKQGETQVFGFGCLLNSIGNTIAGTAVILGLIAVAGLTLFVNVASNFLGEAEKPKLTLVAGIAASENINPIHRTIGLSEFRENYPELDGEGMRVAIIDIGISEPDEVGSLFDDFYFGPGSLSDPPVDPSLVHGIGVASIVTTPRGLAPGTRIISLNVTDQEIPSAATVGEDELLAALDWIIDVNDTNTQAGELPTIPVVLIPYASGHHFNVTGPLWYNAETDQLYLNEDWRQYFDKYAERLSTLAQQGVIVVTPAGNAYETWQNKSTVGVGYPCSHQDTVCVGAHFAVGAQAGQIMPNSQRDPATTDVMAPGDSTLGFSLRSEYKVIMKNTSAASSYIAGAAILMQQYALNCGNSPLTLETFRELLVSAQPEPNIFDFNAGETHGYRSLNIMELAEAYDC